VIYKPLSAGDIREAVVRKGENHGISQQVSASILAWRCACGRQGCQPAHKHIVCLSVGDMKPVPVDGEPLYSYALRRHSYVSARPKAAHRGDFRAGAHVVKASVGNIKCVVIHHQVLRQIEGRR